MACQEVAACRQVALEEVQACREELHLHLLVALEVASEVVAVQGDHGNAS